MRMLLDAHLPRPLAEQLRGRGLDAVDLQEWMGGSYLRVADELILAAAHQDHRVLITCDRRTIPEILSERAQTGSHHGGVVLVAGKGLRPSNVGGLLRALMRLAEACGEDDWEDRVIYLAGE